MRKIKASKEQLADALRDVAGQLLVVISVTETPRWSESVAQALDAFRLAGREESGWYLCKAFGFVPITYKLGTLP